jgi:hypothetical protein
LVFVFSDVLLCIELIYTLALPSYKDGKEKPTVLKKKKSAEMRVTVMCLFLRMPVTVKWDEGTGFSGHFIWL